MGERHHGHGREAAESPLPWARRAAAHPPPLLPHPRPPKKKHTRTHTDVGSKNLYNYACECVQTVVKGRVKGWIKGRVKGPDQPPQWKKNK